MYVLSLDVYATDILSLTLNAKSRRSHHIPKYLNWRKTGLDQFRFLDKQKSQFFALQIFVCVLLNFFNLISLCPVSEQK